MTRKNLVIVRAGDSSLHPDWLRGKAERNWDLVVNYFGAKPPPVPSEDITYIYGKGPKWPALHELISSNPQLTADYDYIWLPDDDLRTDKTNINRLFEICREYNLEVAQPALTWNSYFGHLTTLQCRKYKVRFTNYVEVMAPCFSAAMLQKSLPLFDSNLSGWGLDFIWTKLAQRPESGIAIVDAVSVCHTRPVGGPNYKALRDGGISPWDELRSFCRTHGIDEDPAIATHKAIRRDGRLVSRFGPRRFALGSLLDYGLALRQTPERKRMLRRLAGMAYKAINDIPDRVSERSLAKR